MGRAGSWGFRHFRIGVTFPRSASTRSSADNGRAYAPLIVRIRTASSTAIRSFAPQFYRACARYIAVWSAFALTMTAQVPPFCAMLTTFECDARTSIATP